MSNCIMDGEHPVRMAVFLAIHLLIPLSITEQNTKRPLRTMAIKLTEQSLPRMLNKIPVILLCVYIAGCASTPGTSSTSSTPNKLDSWFKNANRINAILLDNNHASKADALIEDYSRHASDFPKDSFWDKQIDKWKYIIGYQLLTEKRNKEAIQYLLRNNTPSRPIDGSACEIISTKGISLDIPNLEGAIFMALDGAQDNRAGEWVHRAYYCGIYANEKSMLGHTFNTENYVSDVRRLIGDTESKQATLYVDNVLKPLFKSKQKLVNEEVSEAYCPGCDSEGSNANKVRAKLAKLYENALKEAHNMSLTPNLYRAIELEYAREVDSLKFYVDSQVHRKVR